MKKCKAVLAVGADSADKEEDKENGRLAYTITYHEIYTKTGYEEHVASSGITFCTCQPFAISSFILHVDRNKFLSNEAGFGTMVRLISYPHSSEYNERVTWHCHEYYTSKFIPLYVIQKLLSKKHPSDQLKPSKLLLFFILLVITQSNDIESNPGPSNDSTRYMCGTCDDVVTWEHRGIVCETCDQWYHIDCQNIHSNTYDLLNDSMISWNCLICENPNYSTCPFDLHGASSSNPFESLYHYSNDDCGIKTPTNSFKPSHQSTPIRKNKTKTNCKTPLRILNINFQSIKRKQHLVQNIIDSTKPDIVIGTETWLDSTIKDIEIFPEEYTLYRKDRKNQQGGGVLIAIKSVFISDEVEDLTPNVKSEMVWSKIEIKGSRSLYISSFYNPKTSDEQSIKWFDTSVRRATQIKNAAILIGGDFNLPGWDWKNKILKPKSTHQNIHYDFGNTLDDTGLVQLIEYPTRKDNILDLMITNLPNQVPRIEIMPGISDHDIVFMEFKITPSKLKQTPRNVPIYNKANWETIKKEVINLQHTIQEKVNTHTVDELGLEFKTKLNELVMNDICMCEFKIKEIPFSNLLKALVRI
ncbi:unnamed protein product [Mytilus coruscus]|uniref:PHD-type domain-containing protein n=1 Tax=Mytilus coruscus TaxID=42192 RepID=A0A6J8B3R5_MYTCO|nr:unnamed protein product [Mytilus coruscus]